MRALDRFGASGTSGPCRMATYAIHTLLVNINITDSPVGYTPSRGPAVEFQVTYNQREVFQPQLFYYSTFGPKWTFDWLSYLGGSPGQPDRERLALRPRRRP